MLDNDIKKTFKNRFIKVIEKIDPDKKMSHKVLAGEIGISPQSFCDYMFGSKFPDTINYIKILKYFHKKISNFNDAYLIGDNNAMSLVDNNLVPEVHLEHELVNRLSEYKDTQSTLVSLLSLTNIQEFSSLLETIQNLLTEDISNIIEYWKNNKTDIIDCPAIHLYQLLEYNNDTIRYHTNHCNHILNEAMGYLNYDIIVKILKNLPLQYGYRYDRKEIKELLNFLEKHTEQVLVSIKKYV